MQTTFEKYSDGRTLYGDDFSPDQLEAWYRDEQEGYYSLGHLESGKYGYHALNWRQGFRHISQSQFDHALGMGSAFGDELQPILSRVKKVTLVDPSDGFANSQFEYVKPKANGLLPFPDNTFDLVTCFNVLHHIPNVSTVVREMARCMKPGGWMLLREPTIPLGNWDYPRFQRTPRERGIPLLLMPQIVIDSGLQIVSQRRYHFCLVPRMQRLLPKKHKQVYNLRWFTALDDYFCNLPVWSREYHITNFLKKFRPWAVSLVLRKPA
jgi:SAM-dependent methyltransferase